MIFKKLKLLKSEKIVNSLKTILIYLHKHILYLGNFKLSKVSPDYWVAKHEASLYWGNFCYNFYRYFNWFLLIFHQIAI